MESEDRPKIEGAGRRWVEIGGPGGWIPSRFRRRLPFRDRRAVEIWKHKPAETGAHGGPVVVPCLCALAGFRVEQECAQLVRRHEDCEALHRIRTEVTAIEPQRSGQLSTERALAQFLGD